VSGQGTFSTLQTNHSPQFFDNFAAEKENMQVETHSWWADDEVGVREPGKLFSSGFLVKNRF
jgi:hypothetical protein